MIETIFAKCKKIIHNLKNPEYILETLNNISGLTYLQIFLLKQKIGFSIFSRFTF